VDLAVAAMLVGAGIFAGILNAVAGGATLVTFPTLMAAGLSPIVANASNALAVMPGNVLAWLADRAQLPRRGRRLAGFVAVSMLGGLIGALLLLATTERLFTQLVPLLIGGATLLYAMAPRLQAIARNPSPEGALAGARAPRPPSRAILWAMVPASVYGGYFGAGLGIMLMTIFTLGGVEDVRRANALKNLSSATCALASVATFIVQGVISWPETALMFSGAVLGGHLGGRLIGVLPAAIMRRIILLVGAILSAVYAARYWF
jgi:uncharacterized membrane protein YfcA